MINLNWHQEMKVQLNFWGTRQEDMRLTSCFVLTVGKDLSVLVTDADETSCSDRKYFKIAFHCDHDRGCCWFYSSTSFSASNKRSLALVCFSHCCWQHLLRCFIELTLWVWAHLPASHMTCISLLFPSEVSLVVNCNVLSKSRVTDSPAVSTWVILSIQAL